MCLAHLGVVGNPAQAGCVRERPHNPPALAFRKNEVKTTDPAQELEIATVSTKYKEYINTTNKIAGQRVAS